MSDLEQRAINLRDSLKEQLAEARAIDAELAGECSPRTFDVERLVGGLTTAHGAALCLVIDANGKRDHLMAIVCYGSRPPASTLEMTPA